MLVIDDDPQVHELLNRTLSREGIRVENALNGVIGMQLAANLTPSIILLDVMMPQMDGWSVLSSLKADAQLSQIPVVMMTMVENKTLGFTLGATDYLTKPLDRQRLLSIVRRYSCQEPPCPILVVEDDPASREMVCKLLERDGWQTIEAENGRVALDFLQQTNPENFPDLILLDLMMPEMDGFELLNELHHHPQWSKIPVIVMTAKDLSEADHHILRGSVEKVLQKGAYGHDELLSRIKELIRRRS